MISNLRDLGGIAAEGGSVIRSGMLIRAASLKDAQPEDLDGISTIIDLRTPGEREEEPDIVCGKEYLELPVFEDLMAGISREEAAAERNTPGMAHLYMLIVRRFTDEIRRIIRAILEHDYSGGAVLWHCSEGKDRTGIIAAIILDILGASREDIMEDYLKTNIINLPKAIRIRDEVLKTEGEEIAERVYMSYIADEAYLNAAYDEMGSDYIRSGLGIDEAAILRFREKVLTR